MESQLLEKGRQYVGNYPECVSHVHIFITKLEIYLKVYNNCEATEKCNSFVSRSLPMVNICVSM